MLSMKLLLLSQREYTTMVLPEKCAGHYWVQSRNSTGRLTEIVSVEAVHPQDSEGRPQWFLRSNRRFQILDAENNPVQGVSLTPDSRCKVASRDGSQEYILLAEPLSEERKRYSVYKLDGKNTRLTIGNKRTSNIFYQSSFISGEHAELTISADGKMSVQDKGSRNHTYVNGKAVEYAQLKNGDAIYMVGLQIIVTRYHLFFSQPKEPLRIMSEHLVQYHAPFQQLGGVLGSGEDALELEEDTDDGELYENYYFRAPRFKHDVDVFQLKLDGPTNNQNRDEMPLAMMIGPSMTMGMASVATGAFAVASAVGRGDVASAIPSIIMSISMMLGTMLWPLITRTYQRRQRRQKETLRQTAYKDYLKRVNKLIQEETARQEDILRKNDSPVSDYHRRIHAQKLQIWERTRKHTDFLSLRLGTGNLPLKADIQYPERKFTVEQDNLEDEMYALCEQKRWLTNVPVCLPLTERFVSGVYATHDRLLTYAKNLILQIVTLHGYDEVKLALIYDEQDAEQLSFVRWLPHTMNQERTARYIATNSDEAKILSTTLDGIIKSRKSLNAELLEEEMPYFVVICLDKELAIKTECVHRIQEYKKNLKFSVLSMFDRLEDLPKECSAVVRLEADYEAELTLIQDVSDPPIPFRTEHSLGIQPAEMTWVLANAEIDVGGSRFALPTQYTFFEMLELGMVEHLNLLDLWSANDPTKSLAVPIGIDRYGELFKLDLHERAHGPHGLIAGMTGSGKSETIIAYILSLAVNFHPYEVAFILIDYKGGGMAKAFKDIPHTAGIITNLDGRGIRRSLISLNSELHRRERIFQEVSEKFKISNIDIYKYQKLYRDRAVSEPLPHLMIISDEFAELKKEQPEFMTELTSTARVGRSLGAHLILATQKPGGVVDDQIRGNSRFRLCLKVQDNGDSMEMLGRPEAAALVNTGRFYLLVGNNELCEIGQSAWAGAPYYPSNRVIKNRDDGVSVIDTNGRILAEANTNRFARFKDPPKQLDVMTSYIKAVSESEGIRRWKMWQDPIPGKIYVDRLSEKYQQPGTSNSFVLSPIIGEYDDPEHQAQGLLRVPLTDSGNVLLYGSAGSGKDMFLNALCYSLLREHTAEEVNLYLLDFGAEMLGAFVAAPHVGDVILSYETEKVNNLFRMLLKKVNARKKLLSQYGTDLLQYNRQAEQPEPNLVVVINNYAAFTELFEDQASELNYLAREGTKYGIYFVLTCTGINNVRLNLRQNFALVYCLQLNQIEDYSTVVGKTDGLYPERFKGRGILRLDKDTLVEFQTASVSPEEPPYAFIRAFAARTAEKSSGLGAAKVPILPQRVTEEFLASNVQPGRLERVPVGVARASLEMALFDFTQSPVTMVLSSGQEWRGFTQALACLLSNRCQVKTMVLSPGGNGDGFSPRCAVFTNVNQCVQAAGEIFGTVLCRNNTYKDAQDAGRDTPVLDPMVVVIQSMAQLKAVLDRYQFPETERTADDDTPLNRLQLAMEKCAAAYQVYFVVAESITALSPFTAESWYKHHVSGNCGIWVGSGVGSQFRFTIHQKPQGAGEDLGVEFGFVIKDSRAELVKLLQPEAEEIG